MSPLGGERAAPDAAAPAAAPGAAPYLVNNPSNTTCGASESDSTWRWSKQQFKIRRLVADRLTYWQSHGYEVHWVTVSSPYGPCERTLREDFEELRRRVVRRVGLGALEYVCVETSEGNGVLHIVWAIKTDKKRAFFVSYGWLSETWAEIRGAWNVSISRVKVSNGDRRRLTRYIVCQYCGGQSGLVRVSQSRLGIPLAKMRAALLRAMRGCTERYEMMKACSDRHPKEENVNWGKLMGQWFFLSLRRAWNDLVATGQCWFFERDFVWFAGKLCEV